MEQQERRCCKICGKKLNLKATKTDYCSLKCVAKDTDLLEDGKNLELSLRTLAKKYKTHMDKVAAVLSDAGIRKAYTRKKVCPRCKNLFHSFTTHQVYCSVKCLVNKTKEEIIANRRCRGARRRALKKQAQTDDANKNLIKLIYQHVPEGYHVDHIIPITKGGLHHEDNLQYLPASENVRKKDRLDYEPQGVIRWQDVIQLTEE